MGNLISDFVKGKKQFDYPSVIQQGIQLHRAIDMYTDTHPATQQLKAFFRPHYRLYSGAFTDVVYDHFLARDTTCFGTEKALKNFAASTYSQLESFSAWFPPAFQKIFPLMKQYDWLYHYQDIRGIEKSFGGLVRRAVYLTESQTAYELFLTHYNGMQTCYNNFFPELQKFSFAKLNELLTA